MWFPQLLPDSDRCCTSCAEFLVSDIRVSIRGTFPDWTITQIQCTLFNPLFGDPIECFVLHRFV